MIIHRYTLFNEWGRSHVKKASSITVNSFQGSEIGTAIYVIPFDCEFETRERLYTAVTRAKERVIVISPNGVIENIVHRREPQYRTTLGLILQQALNEHFK